MCEENKEITRFDENQVEVDFREDVISPEEFNEQEFESLLNYSVNNPGRLYSYIMCILRSDTLMDKYAGKDFRLDMLLSQVTFKKIEIDESYRTIKRRLGKYITTSTMYDFMCFMEGKII